MIIEAVLNYCKQLANNSYSVFIYNNTIQFLKLGYAQFDHDCLITFEAPFNTYGVESFYKDILHVELSDPMLFKKIDEFMIQNELII